MVKTRGLLEANKKLGNLENIISSMLKKKKKVKIFESGCGYGKVMLELKKKFGNKIEIIGMNRLKLHGDKKKMISFALKERLIDKKDLKKFNSIKIIFGDAGKKLPFKTNSIDLVYSQVSSYLYKDKLHFFEEVARILSKEGIGLITYPDAKKVSKKYKPLLGIYKGNKLISSEKFINKFKGIKVIKRESKRIIKIKGGKLNFNAKLMSVIDVHKFNKNSFGVVSNYNVSLK